MKVSKGKDTNAKTALVDRHKKGKNIYTKYQLSKINEKKIQEAMQGKKMEQIVPKPGEFVVVATDKLHDPQQPIAVPLQTIIKRSAPFVKESLDKLRSNPSVRTLKSIRPMTGTDERSHTQRLNSNEEDPLYFQDVEEVEFGMEDIPMKEEPKWIVKEKEVPKDFIKLLEENQFKTSMTTSLKNIMRRQKKELLIPSSNLMHTGVLHDIMKDPAIVTSRPSTAKQLVRPSSSYALVKRSGKDIKCVQEKTEVCPISLSGARLRDKQSEKWNSYKVAPQNYSRIQSAQRREIAVGLGKKDPILEKQEEMKRENNLTSPFMESRDVKKMPVDSNFDPKPKKERKRDNDMTKSGISELETKIDDDFHTLPLEAYDPFLGIENGEELLNKHRTANGRVYGRSRWFYTDGTSEFRDCEILSYDKEASRYVIKWSANGIIKKASRFNLRIDGEDVSLLQYRVNAAIKKRKIAEDIIQCNLIIDNISTPAPDLPQKIKDQICYLTHAFPSYDRPYRNVIEYLLYPKILDEKEKYFKTVSYKFPRLTQGEAIERKEIEKNSINKRVMNSLIKEIDSDYKRSFKVMEFQAQLPYKQEYFENFKEIISIEKFRPVSEKIIEESPNHGVLNIGERSKPFLGLLQEMSGKLHQGDSKRLETLIAVNSDFNKFRKEIFFATTIGRSVEKKNYLDINSVKQHKLMSDWKDCMIFASEKIKSMISEVKAQIDQEIQLRLKAASHASARKNIGESRIPDEVVMTLRRFQSLVNFIFERGIRESYEKSVEKFIESFQEVSHYVSESLNIPEKILKEGVELDLKGIRRIADDAILQHRMKNKLRLICQIKFRKEEGIFFVPDISSWKTDIFLLLDDLMKLILKCNCLFSTELGYARESQLMLVFPQGKNNQFTLKKKEELGRELDVQLNLLYQLQKSASQYSDILHTDREIIKSKFLLPTVTREEYDAELKRLEHAQEELEFLFSSDRMLLGIFQVDCQKLRETFSRQIAHLKSVVLHCIKARINFEADNIESGVNEIMDMVCKIPPEIEDLVEQNLFLQTLETRRVGIQEIILEIFKIIGLLEQYNHKLSEKEMNKTFATFTRTLEIVKVKREAMLRNSTLWGEYKDRLKADTSICLLEVGTLKLKLDQLQTKLDINDYNNIAYEFNELGDKINAEIEKSEVILSREKLFMLPNSSFEELENTKKLFTPYNEIWNITRDYFYNYPQWTTGPITALNREKVKDQVDNSIKALNDFRSNDLLDDPGIKENIQIMLQHFIDFKPMLPLIFDLRNPAMVKRHWDVVRTITKIDIPEDLQISLNDLISKGIEKYKDQLNEVSDFASKERGLLQDIEKMRKEWLTVKFDMAQYLVDSEPYIITSFVSVIDRLEDQIARTLVIAASPYTKYIEAEVQYWKNHLTRSLDLVEIWAKIQKNWGYLFPMFSSNEWVLQLPKEAAQFETINSMWISTMANTKQNPAVMESLTQGKQYETYVKSNRQLETILKGINDYLDKKRLQFPRFFFISNEDLIFFISREKNPTSLEPSLHKCFEGIIKLELNETNEITGIRSESGEIITFSPTIPLTFEQEGQILYRKVEEWLKDIEESITISLKTLLAENIAEENSDISVKQIEHLISLLHWTRRTENSIVNKNLKELREYYIEKIHRSVLEVRSFADKLFRKETGIILDIHNAEVLDFLQSAEVVTTHSFEWQTELRYYFDREEEAPYCKMMEYQREYGFDYLSDSSRLIITPLTKRCYRVLLTALNVFCGGSIEGPPGVGKTETIKDLGKAIGKHCLVFSGSSGIKVESFKGVACCGLWVCINDFNQIQLEVVSVIAQYIHCVFAAIKSGSDTIDLHESTTMLNRQCGIFITHNPGRTVESGIELPETLKKLFRSTTLIVPDKRKIVETYLTSFGYEEANTLANLIITAFDLAESQLSQSRLYDFSLRTLKNNLLQNVKSNYIKHTLKKSDMEAKHEEENADTSQQDAIIKILNPRAIIKKALQDCYLPRMGVTDAVIFNHIISDLFPKIEDFQEETLFDQYVSVALSLFNLEQTSTIHQQIVKLHEIFQVQHGVIIVGEACSGKSTLIKILHIVYLLRDICLADQDSFEAIQKMLENTSLEKRLLTEENASNFHKQFHKQLREACLKLELKYIETNWISPKSIKVSNIYGEFDSKRNAWMEGILPSIVRKSIVENVTHKYWIVFDSEIDQSWTDSMSSILDSPRRLNLANSESLILPGDLKLFFESDVLSSAAPATISRCGVINLNSQGSDQISWELAFESWINTLPPAYRTYSHIELYHSLKKEFLEPVFNVLWGKSRGIKMVTKVSQIWACKNVCTVLEALLFYGKTREDLEKQNTEEVHKLARREAYMKMEATEPIVESPSSSKRTGVVSIKEILEITDLFLLSVIWGIGPLISPVSSADFLATVRNKFNRIRSSEDQALEFIKDSETVFPPEDIPLDMLYLDRKEKMWGRIADILPKKDFSEFTLDLCPEILVPNEETYKYMWILRLLIQQNTHTMLIGSTNCGKSLLMKTLLSEDLVQSMLIRNAKFSGTTKSERVSEMIMNNFEKRIKNLYAPKGIGKKFLFAVDDLHLPFINQQGGHEHPLELIRQILCHHGILDINVNQFKELSHYQMALTVTTRADMTTFSPRLGRHFNIVQVKNMTDTLVSEIFHKLCEWGFMQYSKEIQNYVEDIVKNTMSIYKTVKEKFVTIPSKCHYRFPLNELKQVLQGMLSIPAVIYEDMGEDEDSKKRYLYSIWMHECVRTFGDKLSSLDDRDTLKEMLISSVDWEIADPLQLIFSSINGGQYQELDLQKAKDIVTSALQEFKVSEKSEFNLVLYETVIQNITSIARLLSVCRTNGLLIGVGGNGRNALTRITAFMLKWKLFSLSSCRQFGKTEWRENLKQLFRQLCTDCKDTVLLITEQLFEGNEEIDNVLIEDIHNILVSGEVNNLFDQKEKDEILSNRKYKSINEFLMRGKDHLKLMLSINPAGNMMRKYIRNYPSLLKNTSAVYFLDWPLEALHSIARSYIEKLPIASDPEKSQKAEDLLVSWHTSATKLAGEYFKETKNWIYITPIWYLDLLQSYTNILTRKYEYVDFQIQKYSKGIECLEEAAVLVQKLGLELESMKPFLEQKNKETEKTMAELVVEKEEAKKLREVVEEKEMRAKIEKEAAEKLKEECDKQLQEELLLLKDANTGISQIKEKDLVETRTYTKPTPIVQTTMEMVLIMLKRKIIIEEVGRKRIKTPNYWKSVQNMLKNIKKVKEDLQHFDKKKLPISEDVIKQIQDRLTILSNEKTSVQQSSGAMLGIFEWVKAILAYDKAKKHVAPKQEAFDEATKRVEATSEEYKKSHEELIAIENKRDELEERFRRQNSEKESLKQQISECQTKLVRAQELTEQLKGEKKSWNEKIKKLQEESQTIFGDTILSAGYVSYMGPFPTLYRKRILTQSWYPLLEQKEIEISPNFSVSTTLANPVDILTWHARGLPSDSKSEENAVIMNESRKFSLLIDPQLQGTQFLIKFSQNKVAIVKNGENYIRKLKWAISSGTAIILEKAEQKLDSILMPILQHQTYTEKNQQFIKLDDTPCLYKDDFRIYLTTTVANPHLSPRVFNHTSVLSFCVSKEAINDQLMHILANIVDYDTEQNKIKMIQKNADNRALRDKKENEILEHIKRLGSKILEEHSLVTTLSDYKSNVDRIESELRLAKNIEDKIEEARAQYKPATHFCANLFFTLLDLQSIDHIYQFSLQYFTDLYSQTVEACKLKEDKKVKIKSTDVMEKFKMSLFQQVSQSLFDQHKLLFALRMMISILQTNNEYNQEIFNMVILPSETLIEEEKIPENALSAEISAESWKKIAKLSMLNKTSFESMAEVDICKMISENEKLWGEFMKSDNQTSFPKPADTLPEITQLALFKILKPNLITIFVEAQVLRVLGETTFKSKALTMKDAFLQSTPRNPIILVITNQDPFPQLQHLAQECNNVKLDIVSLGKDQGSYARKRILEMRKQGGWLLLQNCHLYSSWMSELEDLIEETAMISHNDRANLHSEYRLWLTTTSSPVVPITIIQKSVKFITESPRGLKENMLRIFNNIKNQESLLEEYNTHPKAKDWRKLFMSLCYFHCILKEKCRYGSIAWKRSYQFRDSDFELSKKLLYRLLSESVTLPFNSLIHTSIKYYYAPCMDPSDEEVSLQLLSQLYSDNVIYSDYKLCKSQDAYYIPSFETVDNYISFIENLPEKDPPEIYGLSPNVEYNCKVKEGNLLENLLQQMSKSRGHGNPEVDEIFMDSTLAQLLGEKVDQLLSILPPEINLKEVDNKFPILFEDSLNSILHQEVMRYSSLIQGMIKPELENLRSALKGKASFTSRTERLCEHLLNNIPNEWIPWRLRKKYAKKGLISYFQELKRGMKVFSDWILEGQPKVFMLQAFWNIKGLFTSATLNYSRRHVCALSKIETEIEPVNDESSEDGIRISGLFLENATWDPKENILVECLPKQRYTEMPELLLKPRIQGDSESSSSRPALKPFRCPLYQGADRDTEPSSFDHSNYIMSVSMFSKQDPGHWAHRNVALLTETDT